MIFPWFFPYFSHEKTSIWFGDVPASHVLCQVPSTSASERVWARAYERLGRAEKAGVRGWDVTRNWTIFDSQHHQLGKTRINMNQPFPSTCWNSTASFSVLLVNPLVRCWCLLAASSLLMQPTILVSLVDSQMVLSITLLLKSKCLAVDSQIHWS